MRYSHQPVIQYTMKLIARKTLFLPRQNRSEHPINVTQKDATQKGATQKGTTQKDVTQKGVAQNKCTWSKNLGWGCVILTLTLTGCDKVKQIASQRNASVTASTTASTTAAIRLSTLPRSQRLWSIPSMSGSNKRWQTKSVSTILKL